MCFAPVEIMSKYKTLLITSLFISDVHIILLNYKIVVRHGSAVGIATAYGLDDRRSQSSRVPVGSRMFTSEIVQTRYGAHPVSCPMNTAECFAGDKATGA
jgi:hypothetical protein